MNRLAFFMARIKCSGAYKLLNSIHSLTLFKLQRSRRSRLLSLDELVAGVLLLYPTYVSRVSRQVCTAEQALAELLSWRASSNAALPFWRKMLRPLLKRD